MDMSVRRLLATPLFTRQQYRKSPYVYEWHRPPPPLRRNLFLFYFSRLIDVKGIFRAFEQNLPILVPKSVLASNLMLRSA